MNSVNDKPLVNEHVFLTGRPPLNEYLGFMTLQTEDGEKADLRILSDEWRSANDHILELERQEAGIADNPPITAIPAHLHTLQNNVLSDPLFKKSFNVVPTDIGIVELDRLVVFQKHINLEYVRKIKGLLGESPDDAAVLKICLPYDHPHTEVQYRRIAANSFVFVSPSEDLRFLEATILEESQITDYSPHGPISGIVGVVVGFGSNFLNAIYAENRLVLNNGSHRAFALRELGITHVPCIIQHVSRREELNVIASGDLAEKPDLYFKEPRPPLLKDYFDPKLRKIVKVPRKLRQVKVTFGIEITDLPAF